MDKNTNLFVIIFVMVHSFYSTGCQKIDERDIRIKKAEESVKLNPAKYTARKELATAYGQKGLNERAIREYQKALEIVPADTTEKAEIHHNLATQYGATGEIDTAINEFNKVLALSPNKGETHNYLCELYCIKGKYDLAKIHCKRALELGAKVDPVYLDIIKSNTTE